VRLVWMKTVDGETVFEDLYVASMKGERGFETPLVPIEGAIFRTAQPELDLDFHNAPRRQIVVPITGEIEVEAGDGSTRHIGPGDGLLADDLTGQGHKSRFWPDDATVMFLLLPNDLDPATLRA